MPEPTPDRLPLYVPHGRAADGGDPVVITPERAGWRWSGLRVIQLPPGGERVLATGEDELAVLPLAGGCVVECEGRSFTLAGRDSVFTRVTDFAYVPRDAEVRVSSAGGCRFALPSARATRRLDPAYGPAEEVPVELRGAGQAARQVNNFLAPEAFNADKLVAVEVLTPEGNWSSYPPHKHDEQRLPEEAQLEEIYYFEVSPPVDPGPPGRGPGFGLHRVYTSGGATDLAAIDLTEAVRDGDVVLIPRGYHGPSVAAPGYHLYYLNVLAGPAEQRTIRGNQVRGRTMAFCDDPAHGWVRATWPGQPADPRLPLTSAGRRDAP